MVLLLLKKSFNTKSGISYVVALNTIVQFRDITILELIL